jgi:hypothetical protein
MNIPNKSGFSAIPCGYRTPEGVGYVWLGQGSTTYFLAIGGHYYLIHGDATVYYYSLSDYYNNNGTGNVRCIKN